MLGETEKLIARVLAEKTYSKLSDMVATRFDNPAKNNAVTRNKESGTVSQALDELSASILVDCKKLFGMMFGRGGEAMTSNDNCLRLVGYSVKGKLEGSQGVEEAGEGMAYERKDKVHCRAYQFTKNEIHFKTSNSKETLYALGRSID